MVFKLVRVDTQEPSKIQLSIGTHVIGRGKFLHNDDTDKRVSRNHAELQVTSDTLTLKSLHQNPCFYIKKSTVESELLHQDNIVSLFHGDKFGLLPDHFWYEVLHCPITEDPAEIQTGITEPEQNGEEEKQRMDTTEEEKQGNASHENAMPDNEETLHFKEEEEATQLLRTASPSLLPPEQEEAVIKTEVTSDSETRSPSKRNHSPRKTSPVDVKKVKMEPVDANNAGAGPSNGQQAVPDSNSTAAPASPQKTNAPMRERCIYGANCYRRNPQHKAQFSHPGDTDWGGGERGVCPYGRACRRRDPRHWAQHEHPPGTLPPTDRGPRPGKRQNGRQRRVSVSDDDEEDSPVDSLIVTGKRARKTVARQDWSGESDSDEDPYGTDDSDEWQPPSDVTNTQDFSQDL